MRDAAILTARILLSWIFIVDGVEMIGDFDATGAYMEMHGVARWLLPLVIAAVLCGGLLVAFGFLTRLAAPGLAGFCLLTAMLFHGDIADPGEWIHFNKDLAIAGGFLCLTAFGPGRLSLDAWRLRRRQAEPRSTSNPGGQAS
jgi:putative oxidoreductase